MFKNLKYLRFVGNKSTRRQNKMLVASDVKASNIQEKMRFSKEDFTNSNAIVTAQDTVAVNTGKIKIFNFNFAVHKYLKTTFLLM